MNTGFVFDRIQRATQKAFDRVGKTANIPTDPDLRIYNDLQPKDFEAMTQKYGQDDVMKYIQEMEAKRLGAINQGGSHE
jgi:hypothetical protein